MNVSNAKHLKEIEKEKYAYETTPKPINAEGLSDDKSL